MKASDAAKCPEEPDVVRGDPPMEKKTESDDDREVLYRGIASRAFERRFQLADYVEVKGANLVNGLLHIDLVREIPEAMKPRRIEIGAGRVAVKDTRTQAIKAA